MDAGKIARAYAELMNLMWGGSFSVVNPRQLKLVSSLSSYLHLTLSLQYCLLLKSAIIGLQHESVSFERTLLDLL